MNNIEYATKKQLLLFKVSISFISSKFTCYVLVLRFDLKLDWSGLKKGYLILYLSLNQSVRLKSMLTMLTLCLSH